jgi:hypothetical protein
MYKTLIVAQKIGRAVVLHPVDRAVLDQKMDAECTKRNKAATLYVSVGLSACPRVESSNGYMPFTNKYGHG